MTFLTRRERGWGKNLKPLDKVVHRSAHGGADAQAQTINVNTTSTSDGSAPCPPKPRGVCISVRFCITIVLTISFVTGTIGFGGGLQVGVSTGLLRGLEAWAEYPLDLSVLRESRGETNTSASSARPTLPPGAPWDGGPYDAEEGGPCRGFERGRCPEALRTEWALDLSDYYRSRGDAEVYLGEFDKAKVFYDWAITVGRPAGAYAARVAAIRLNFLGLTCHSDEDSLARIARDKEFNILGGEITTLQRQRALKALAHYAGPLDGHQSGELREAIRRFQASLWYSETGVLTAEQTVLLVCGAAEIGQDAASKNLLGTMYAAGLGVRQNTDKALLWFNEAARQGSADASWNLALLFGTQMTEASVLVCDADLSPDRADSFLKEAYAAGHPAAVRAVERYGEEDPVMRWRKLAGDLNQPEALSRVGKGCNPNG
ncbi:MAG: tetratricopeptide repeat protein [Parvularcula sp.]|jgi:TPR repeat protein|nr:tetratricopeptide repeat protein [Parvularcula sp.]